MFRNDAVPWRIEDYRNTIRAWLAGEIGTPTDFPD
jgi:hypothetical protein